MKVYNAPIDFNYDYTNFDRNALCAAEEKYTNDLKRHLTSMGYTGKHTGRIYRTPVADGYAAYMIADGSKSMLIHMPFGDAYHSPDVKYLPKAEILRRITADENLSKLFAKSA